MSALLAAVVGAGSSTENRIESAKTMSALTKLGGALSKEDPLAYPSSPFMFEAAAFVSIAGSQVEDSEVREAAIDVLKNYAVVFGNSVAIGR